MLLLLPLLLPLLTRELMNEENEFALGGCADKDRKLPESPIFAAMDTTEIKTRTEKWVKELVIGLNLCPFAQSPFEGGRVRIVVSEAKDHEALLKDFLEEVKVLVDSSMDETETTLLVHPYVFNDFYAYNDFLGLLEELLFEGELETDFQIASFHPDYQFAGTLKGAPENYTNKSPFPILHLLRQASVNRAVETYPDTAAIPGRNIELMEEMGSAKLKALFGY